MIADAVVGGAVLDRPSPHARPRPVSPGLVDRPRRVSRRYLLVTEGGAAGRAAAAWVGAACREESGAEITLLYVLTPQFRYPMLFEESPSGYAEPLDVALAHESRIAFDEARHVLDLPRDVLREVARIGWVEPVVLRAAELDGYRAVVIGRRRDSGISALFRPDPIRTLWRRLPCPLVVVPS